MDAGQGHVHNGINASQTEEAVVYVTCLDVPPGGPPTLPLGDAEPVPCRP